MPVIKTSGGELVEVDMEAYNRLSAYSYHKIKSSGIIQRGIYSKKLKRTVGRKGLAQDVLQVPSSQVVIFIDGNTKNCKKDNLKKIPNSKRNYNARLSKSSTTGFKGVSLNDKTKKFNAYIRHKNKKINLGSYDNIVQAALAYNEKAKELFGDRARLNVV